MSADKRQAIASPILGVHRSGTSAVAGLLHALNVRVGDIGGPGGTENPKGFFESRTVRTISDEVFSVFGSEWSDWTFGSVPLDGNDDRLHRLDSAAAAFLTEHFAGERVWAVKDPRMATLWDFWRPVFAKLSVDLRPILVVRDPAEVAASQATRAATNPAFHRRFQAPDMIAALWCNAMVSILRNLGRSEILVVRFDDLHRDPRKTVDRMVEYLQLQASDSLIEECKKFIESDLYRSKPDLEPAPWVQIAQSVYADLVNSTKDCILSQRDAEDLLNNNKSLERLTHSLSFFRPLAAAERAMDRLNHSVSQIQSKFQNVLDFGLQSAEPAFEKDLLWISEFLSEQDSSGTGNAWRAAIVSERLGDRRKALHHLSEVLKRDPDFAPARVAKTCIELIEASGAA